MSPRTSSKARTKQTKTLRERLLKYVKTEELRIEKEKEAVWEIIKDSTFKADGDDATEFDRTSYDQTVQLYTKLLKLCITLKDKSIMVEQELEEEALAEKERRDSAGLAEEEEEEQNQEEKEEELRLREARKTVGLLGT